MELAVHGWLRVTHRDWDDPLGSRVLERVRVAFVEVPRLLRELSVALLPSDDRVEIQEFELGADGLAEAVAAGGIEVLVADQSLGSPEEICRLLASSPRLKALVVLDEGRRAAFYELRPNCELREMSAAMLGKVVAAARRPCDDTFGAAHEGQ